MSAQKLGVNKFLFDYLNLPNFELEKAFEMIKSEAEHLDDSKINKINLYLRLIKALINE